MANFYYKRVINGHKKWTKVPSLWFDDVVQMLKDNGYTLNDDGTVTKEENKSITPTYG